MWCSKLRIRSKTTPRFLAEDLVNGASSPRFTMISSVCLCSCFQNYTGLRSSFVQTDERQTLGKLCIQFSVRSENGLHISCLTLGMWMVEGPRKGSFKLKVWSGHVIGSILIQFEETCTHCLAVSGGGAGKSQPAHPFDMSSSRSSDNTAPVIIDTGLHLLCALDISA